VDGARAITGEIRLLFHEVDDYGGDVLLLSLDTDEPSALDTFEIRGPLAARLGAALAEGMRVRVDCVPETVEMVSQETGETSDATRAVVVDVVVLGG
jgi:hypothetical protein